MKLTELYEAVGTVIQLQLNYYHESGERPEVYTEVKEFPSNKMAPKWYGPHEKLSDIYWRDDQVSRDEGIRRIDFKYNDNDANNSLDDDDRHVEAIGEFKQKTNKNGKFFYTEYEGIENDEWFLTFFPR